MSSDPDSCIPGPLKDFVFDLHDSVCTSQIHSEQLTLYNGTFRELSSKVRWIFGGKSLMEDYFIEDSIHCRIWLHRSDFTIDSLKYF